MSEVDKKNSISPSPSPSSNERAFSDSLLIRTTHIVLLLMSLMYLLVFAQDILIPLVYGFFLSTLLYRPMRLLQKTGMPKVIAAMLPLLFFFSALCICLYFSKAPAMEMGAKIPKIIHQIKGEMGLLTAEIDKVTEHAKNIQDAVGDVVGDKQVQTHDQTSASQSEFSSTSQIGASPVEQVPRPGAEYGDSVLESVFHSLWLVLISFLLCYFFLIGGDPLSRNIAAFRRSEKGSQQVFQLIREVRANLSRYLAVALVVNLAFGLMVAAILFFLDIDMFWLWGLLAGLLRFIPYLGPLIALVMVTVATASAHIHMPDLFIAPGAMLILLFIFGNFVDPFAHAQRFKLNPIAIFVSIVFWSWIWGVAGTFIAVPILVVLVAVCGETERLKRFYYILCTQEIR